MTTPSGDGFNTLVALLQAASDRLDTRLDTMTQRLDHVAEGLASYTQKLNTYLELHEARHGEFEARFVKTASSDGARLTQLEAFQNRLSGAKGLLVVGSLLLAQAGIIVGAIAAVILLFK